MKRIAVFLTGFILVVKGVPALAENCPECPKDRALAEWKSHSVTYHFEDERGESYTNRYGLGWGDFHCDQIRQLKLRVAKLEREIENLKSQIKEG